MGQSYRELIAWQKAMAFVMDVYSAGESVEKSRGADSNQHR